MKSLLLLTAALGMFTASPAAACQYTQVPENVGDGSALFFARRMVAAAAHVDLVLMEDDGVQPMDALATGVLTMRSVAHFKGSGPDRFSLFGDGLTFRPEAERVFKAPLQHFTSEDGRVTPFPYNEERQGRLFPNLPGDPPSPTMTSCSPNAIAGQSGRFYVVMRGADGRLLGNLPLHDRSRESSFAFVPVTLDADDHWLRAVRMALYGGTSTPGPSVLHLRADADPARVQAALRRGGITAVAAFVRSGDWIDEIRPADGEARSAWLTRAVPLVLQRNRGGVAPSDHSAAEFLRSKLGVAQTYGGLGYEVAQAFGASVRRRQAAKAATPRLVAIAITGPADAVTAFSREPFADGMRPLATRTQGLASLPGDTEAAQFAAMQTIERDIWLLNGGNGNPQGTLPEGSR